ncbi:hypothetical protein EYF80_026850 [Liparis tanakae]|uniref:Uncharacterized protein n=1 Tax=Liparis tanakae TaxID=230148 RepID=A0A4Z2HAJ4_9TELE|nr:hypothetical protein EYF80_026850 [Liparis tanakae]
MAVRGVNGLLRQRPMAPKGGFERPQIHHAAPCRGAVASIGSCPGMIDGRASVSEPSAPEANTARLDLGPGLKSNSSASEEKPPGLPQWKSITGSQPQSVTVGCRYQERVQGGAGNDSGLRALRFTPRGRTLDESVWYRVVCPPPGLMGNDLTQEERGRVLGFKATFTFASAAAGAERKNKLQIH